MATKKLFYRMAIAASVPCALIGAPAVAAPLIRAPAIEDAAPPIVQIRSDCHWVDNKWTYQRGDKRLVCRPDRPRGNSWRWHREGTRYGWYNPGRKSWHNRNW